MISGWWRDLDLTSKLPYKIRDRIVESYFGAVAMHYEPSDLVQDWLLLKFVR